MPKIVDHKGFLAILNPDCDAFIRTRMTGIEARVLIFIHRYTRGYGRNYFNFKVRTAAAMMNIDKASFYRALNSMQQRGVIRIIKGRERIRIELIECDLITPWPEEKAPDNSGKPATESRRDATQSGNPATHSGRDATQNRRDATQSGRDATADLYKEKQYGKDNSGKKKRINMADAQKILDRFNELTGKTVPMSTAILGLIQSRIGEGFSEQDFDMSARMTKASWETNTKMVSNITPKVIWGVRMGEYCNLMTAEQLAFKEGRYDDV